MKKYLLFSILMGVCTSSYADTYQVTFGWTDPTTYLPSDAPVYEAKYRVNGGAETVIPGLTTPGGSTSITANPGNPIEMAGRECNIGLCSTWTNWATATAPYAATQPQQGTGMAITVIRTGP